MPIMNTLHETPTKPYEHHMASFQHFIEYLIPHELENGKTTIFENTTPDYLYRYWFKFENVVLKPPTHENDEEYLYPEVARRKHLTYDGKLLSDVTQLQDKTNIATGETTTVVVGKEKGVLIGRIPIPVKSKYCTTNLKKGEPHTECRYDPGGYFISKGNEKVILSVEAMVDNKEVVYTKKDAKFTSGYMHTIHIKSISPITSDSQIVSISFSKDNKLSITMPQFSQIPVIIFIRAMGILTDKDIVGAIIQKDSDNEMLGILNESLNATIDETIEGNQRINTVEQAINYMVGKLPHNRRYDSIDPEIQNEQKRMYFKKIITDLFLPHMGTDVIKKAYYVCYMVHKLLSCYMGRIPVDDRDDYNNKRVETPGVLLYQLFRQYFKKMIAECNKVFRKKFRLENGNDNPVNIINQIKPNIIHQGIQQSLAKGSWGSTKKVGVSQMLQRYNFLKTVSDLRRLMTPAPDANTNKIVGMRLIHSNQFGYVCPVESPDGGKIGISKNMSITAGITINMPDQIVICKKLMESYVIDLKNIHTSLFGIYCKVFINGAWMGMCKHPQELDTTLRKSRRNGILHKSVGIAFNRAVREMRIYTDGGRLIRPLVRVEDNRLMATEEILQDIKQSQQKLGKAMTWNELLVKYPDVIDMVDVEESRFTLVAMYPHHVDEQRSIMNQDIDQPDPKGDPINRYDRWVYKRYTHCEIHPTAMLGLVTLNSPFVEHNQGPRNIYQYGMGRQSKGIYASNYRLRMDISYMLYNPQAPIVTTQAMNYLGTYNLPAGENAVVAIQCYTGYNQEDSVVMNQSALERGLFRSCTLKKYEEVIGKNTSTSQDDMFMKPERSKVMNMRKANYDKLNALGHIPEEGVVHDNDVIIGKAKPVQPMGSSVKILKDASKTYRSNVSGVVDKIETKVFNNDGYEMYNMRIRSERIPKIGDKFSCYTPNHDILTDAGWVPIAELTMEHKVASLCDNDTMRYVQPTDIQSYDFDGDIYNLKSAKVSLSVTPNHRMYVRNRTNPKYKIETAEEVYGKFRKYKCNVEQYEPRMGKDDLQWVTPDGSQFILPAFEKAPAKHLDMDAWLTFLGIWFAEGCTLRSWGVSIATHKQRVKDSLEEVCPLMNYDIIKHKNQKDDTVKNAWCIKDKQLLSYIKPLSVGAINKQLPSWVWCLSMTQCRTLIAGMMLGDGHTMKNGTRRYDTSSKQLADDFHRLCIHAGYAASIILKYPAGHKSHIASRNETITSTADAYRITIIETRTNPLVNKNKGNGKQQDSWVPYKGKVHCCTVNSGIVYVRKDGLGVWCGNSRHGQ